MTHAFILVTLSLVLTFAKENPQAKLEFLDYCKYFNYPVEVHYIKCDDGYINTFYRIQKKNSTIRKLGLTPIYLQHGLLDSSDTWLINDERRAPGFILANWGYDIWLGNSRGNKHSLNHTKYNPKKDPQFWQFTFQDMADYDIPAAFRYIANATQKKVNYIGHSQGTVQMHIALSKNNALVESLIDKYFGFGPVAYVNHQEAHIFKLLDDSNILQWYEKHNIYDFMPSLNWFESDIGRLFCADFPHVCGDIFTQIMDGDPKVDNYERYDVVAGHDPSGTSVMNMAHWKQMADSGKFQAYDYGSFGENIARYGQPIPPIWDLGSIRIPMRLFGGSSDLLADPVDLARLWSELNPSVKTFLKIYSAGHCTYMWGIDVDPWMNDVLKFLQQ